MTTIPLITALKVKAALGATLPRTGKKRRTREIEEALGFPRCRYFYAGRAHPEFGDVALVYDPEVEGGAAGSATPFDSGTVWRGYCHPFEAIHEEEERAARALALVEDVCEPIENWRAAFDDYLQSYFSEPLEYLRGEDPDWSSGWGPEDLPANHEENSENWRSWTWEVRLHIDHPVQEGLRAVALSRHAEDYLEEQIRSSTNRDVVEAAMALLDLEPLVSDIPSEAFQSLEQRIQDEL